MHGGGEGGGGELSRSLKLGGGMGLFLGLLGHSLRIIEWTKNVEFNENFLLKTF